MILLQLLIVQLSGKVAAKLANTTIYKQMNDSLAEPFSMDLDQFVDKGNVEVDSVKISLAFLE